MLSLTKLHDGFSFLSKLFILSLGSEFSKAVPIGADWISDWRSACVPMASSRRVASGDYEEFR